jgi:hypothetical protein
MEAFGLEREAELRKFLELPERIPDESTFFRVFQRVNSKELPACLSWVMEARELRQPDVNIGGKTIWGRRGEDPVHAVSAWAGEEQIVLGQVNALHPRIKKKNVRERGIRPAAVSSSLHLPQITVYRSALNTSPTGWAASSSFFPEY